MSATLTKMVVDLDSFMFPSPIHYTTSRERIGIPGDGLPP